MATTEKKSPPVKHRHKPFYVEVEWRDWGGKWPHEEDDPDDILRQVLVMICNNAKRPKWVRENLKVTVYRDRVVYAEHNCDEVK